MPTFSVGIKFSGGADNAGWSLGYGALGSVQLGEADDPNLYIDVASDVRAITINRGRSRELEQYQVRRCCCRRVYLAASSRRMTFKWSCAWPKESGSLFTPIATGSFAWKTRLAVIARSTTISQQLLVGMHLLPQIGVARV